MINVIDPDEFMFNDSKPQFKSIESITLGELIEDGIFNWERIDWEGAAFSPGQYARLCAAFEDRFYFRDIGITPVGAWFRMLHYELVYKLMPKYGPLYQQLESGEFDPLQNGGEYAKERKVESEFPETLLNGDTQDYLSRGYDYERESVGRGNFADDIANYLDKAISIDDAILTEIDKSLFSSLFTTNVNGW